MKKLMGNLKGTICLILVLAVLFTLAGCGNVDAKENQGYGDYAYSFLEKLDEGFAKREASSKNEKIMAEFIFSEFESFGLNVSLDEFDYDKKVTDANGEKTTKSVSSQNVIGKKDIGAEKTIIVGAHYDSVVAGNGVDDNGSGVAILLEAAKFFKDNNSKFNLIFIAFGAEEVGCKGSKAYVEGMTEAEIANVELMINLDSLAGGDVMYVYGGPDSVSKDYLEKALSFSTKNSLDIVTQQGHVADYPKGETGNWSDHAAFKNAGIPILYFEATNWEIKDADGNYTDGYVQIMGKTVDYAIMHTPQDNLSYLNSAFPGRVQTHMTNFAKAVIEMAKG